MACQCCKNDPTRCEGCRYQCNTCGLHLRSLNEAQGHHQLCGHEEYRDIRRQKDFTISGGWVFGGSRKQKTAV